ncbi:hypothetical protein BDR06DRAFT_955374 [Suillus hirtellus]|nr:hypothetical protein BDR06DRAFT_955374 [Suillus hirtellus]
MTLGFAILPRSSSFISTAPFFCPRRSPLRLVPAYAFGTGLPDVVLRGMCCTALRRSYFYV